MLIIYNSIYLSRKTALFFLISVFFGNALTEGLYEDIRYFVIIKKWRTKFLNHLILGEDINATNISEVSSIRQKAGNMKTLLIQNLTPENLFKFTFKLYKNKRTMYGFSNQYCRQWWIQWKKSWLKRAVYYHYYCCYYQFYFHHHYHYFYCYYYFYDGCIFPNLVVFFRDLDILVATFRILL